MLDVQPARVAFHYQVMGLDEGIAHPVLAYAELSSEPHAFREKGQQEFFRPDIGEDGFSEFQEERGLQRDQDKDDHGQHKGRPFDEARKKGAELIDSGLCQIPAELEACDENEDGPGRKGEESAQLLVDLVLLRACRPVPVEPLVPKPSVPRGRSWNRALSQSCASPRGTARHITTPPIPVYCL